MDPSLTEDFFMLMEDEEELEAVEEPRLTGDMLAEEQEEDEETVVDAVEEVTLEDALIFLFQKYTESREEFPAGECDWYEMDPEERTNLALEKVEEIFEKVLEEGDTSLNYPTLNDWRNVQFRTGYGIQPLEDSQVYLSRIWGGSLMKFLHVLDVMRTLLQSNTRTTKRDIFYQHVRHFGSQREVDRLVSIAVAMLEVSSAPC